MKNFKILNSKKVKLLILMSLVLTLTLGAYLYKGKEIDLEVDGAKIDTVSYSKTVGEFLEEDEINFEEGAFVNLPLETKIESKMDIIIINPKTYSLKQEDGLKAVSSIYETVGDILKDQEIELGELDYTKPASSEKMEAEGIIEIVRVKEETVVEEEKIDFKKIREATDTLYKDNTKLKQKGVNGIKAKHIKKRYENGKLTKEELVKEEVTTEKKDHIVLIGTKARPAPKPKPAAKVKKEQAISRSSIFRSRVAPTNKQNTNTNNAPKASNDAPKTTNNAPKATKDAPKATKNAPKATKNAPKATNKPKASQSPKAPSKKVSSNSAPNGKTMMMNASAYDLSYASCGKRPGDKGYGITASGMKAGPGVVAVDSSVIPLGTKLYIEGYGNAVAGDTGGAIKGNRIDLFFSSHSAALNFGRRQVKVTILN